MNPDDAAIDRPFIGIDRVIAGHCPFKSCCIVFKCCFRRVLVAGGNIGAPLVHQVIAPVGTGRIAENSRGALRRVVIPIIRIERNVPVAGLGQVERLIVEEIGVVQLVLGCLAFGDIHQPAHDPFSPVMDKRHKGHLIVTQMSATTDHLDLLIAQEPVPIEALHYIGTIFGGSVDLLRSITLMEIEHLLELRISVTEIPLWW